jgi:preprotein translocase subunit SecF
MFSFAEFGNDLYSGKRSFDFVGRRRLWYLLAAAAVVIAGLGLGLRGMETGVEFRGGADFTVTNVKDPSDIVGREAVTSVVPDAEPRVTIIGGNKVRITTSTLESNDIKDKLVTSLAKAYDVNESDITSTFVGPSWGKDVSGKALRALLIFLVLVAIVIAVYFRTWKMAVSALVALMHDLALTVGIYAIVGFEVTPASVIGFLTILGYSLYDTVVVFDKVRENTEHITASTRYTYAESANLSINQTLVRSINTSVVALLPVGSILFIGALLMGAGTLKDLSLALFVGMAVGTYSSIFIATPMLVSLRANEPALVAQAERVRRRRSAEAKESVAKKKAKGEPEAVAVGAAAASGTAKASGSGQRVQPKKGSRKR